MCLLITSVQVSSCGGIKPHKAGACEWGSGAHLAQGTIPYFDFIGGAQERKLERMACGGSSKDSSY